MLVLEGLTVESERARKVIISDSGATLAGRGGRTFGFGGVAAHDEIRMIAMAVAVVTSVVD